MNKAVVFDPPRWPNAPLMCRTENRPAFPSIADQKAYYEKYCPRVHVDRVWLCEVCGRYHAEGHGPDPSGSTSGTGRSNK